MLKDLASKTPAPISSKIQEDSICDFSKMETILTVEKILRSTFSNSDRRKFPRSSFNNKLCDLCPGIFDCENLIKRISTELSFQMREMAGVEIGLDQRKHFDPDINAEEWFEEIKKLQWYGPFEGGPDVYRFQTADASGKFYGFHFKVYLNEKKRLTLNFIKLDNRKNKKQYSFKSESAKEEECTLI